MPSPLRELKLLRDPAGLLERDEHRFKTGSDQWRGHARGSVGGFGSEAPTLTAERRGHRR